MASIPIEEVTKDQLWTYLWRATMSDVYAWDFYMHPYWARLCADFFAYPEIVPDRKLDGSYILGRLMHVSDEYGTPELRHA